MLHHASSSYLFLSGMYISSFPTLIDAVPNGMAWTWMQTDDSEDTASSCSSHVLLGGSTSSSKSEAMKVCCGRNLRYCHKAIKLINVGHLGTQLRWVGESVPKSSDTTCPCGRGGTDIQAGYLVLQPITGTLPPVPAGLRSRPVPKFAAGLYKKDHSGSAVEMMST